MDISLLELSKLLKIELQGDASCVISHVTADTREVRTGSLFVAYTGTVLDGHQFIEEALLRGASAVLVSNREAVPAGASYLLAAEPRRCLSQLSSLFAGKPSEKLLCVGITGTNGKSTTHFLLHHALEALGNTGGRIGTIGFEMTGAPVELSNLTTPGAVELHRLLGRIVDAGLQHATMEVASHGLHQFRVEDVAFDIGIFTNLTPDHLDYHPNVEEYFLAKRRLFDLLAENDKKKLRGEIPKNFPTFAVLNIDCPYGKRLADYCHENGLPYYCYGFSERADLRILRLSQTIKGSDILFGYREEQFLVQSPLIGRFNAENLAAVVQGLLGLGYASQEIAKRIPALPPVPGRLEPLGDSKFGIYVDYAHTPDALEKALQALRELAPKNLWVLFGCGGDRDPGRRFGMGKAAAAFADRIVITSDNPRTEDPKKIIDDILSTGCPATIVEPDRRLAIQKTLQAAEAGDIVLVAGKGHEDYQIIGKEKFPFSDQDEIRKFQAGGLD